MTLYVPMLWMNVLPACENRDSNNIAEKSSGPRDILFFQLVTT